MAKDPASDPETILNLALIKGLGHEVSDGLKSADGWPFDLGTGAVNDRERTVLSLWWFSNCVLRAIQGPELDEKTGFLDHVHDFAYKTMLRAGLPADRIKELQSLTSRRYQNYYSAFEEAWTRWVKKQRVSFAPFTRMVTKNLYGHESDDILVDTLITIRAQSLLLSFAATFNNERSWAAMKAAVGLP
jgi:hypothetical protein